LQYEKYKFTPTTAATSPAKRRMGLLCLNFKHKININPLRKFGVFCYKQNVYQLVDYLFWEQEVRGFESHHSDKK